MNSYVIMLIICVMPSLLNSMNPNKMWIAAFNGITYGEWLRAQQLQNTTPPVTPVAVELQKGQTDEKQ